MSDLVTFLLAQLDADEAAARAATPGPWQAHTGRNRMASITVGEEVWVGDIDHDPDAAHVARHDPARVLADCEALRAVVGGLVALGGGDERDYRSRLALTDEQHAVYVIARDGLLALAQPFAGRPGWRDEWGINGHKEAQG